MKKARRQELRSNELSIYLQQVYDAASRNANYVIGGVVVVAAILIIGFVLQSNKRAARQTAWNDYYAVREKSSRYSADQPDQKPDAIITEVRRLADKHKSDSELGPRFMELEVDIAYRQAMITSPTAEREKRLALLKEARSAATQLLDRYAAQPEVAHRARMTLAAVEESLFLMGDGSLETVRKLYQSVLDASPNPFASEAKKQLDSLAKRTEKLELVATRPAEPPASQATGATQPAPPSLLNPPPPPPSAPAETPPAAEPAPEPEPPSAENTPEQ